MKPKPSRTDLTTGDKIGAGCVSLPVLGCCGPSLFMAFAVLILLPVFLVTDDPPGWFVGIAAVLALVLTVAIVYAISLGMAKRRKEDEVIRDARLKRAKDELDD